MGQKMKLKLHSEICCDDCMNTIHVHMDCPSCKKEQVGTDHYGEIFELEQGDTLRCDECGATFVLKKMIPYLSNYSGYFWEKVS